MNDLLKLLETIEKKRLLGTLVLGRGRSSYEVFFEDELVYVPAQSFHPKVDVHGLAEIGALDSKLNEAALDNLVMSNDLSARVAPQTFLDRGLISEDEFERLTCLHLQEEIFQRFLENATSFHFQENHVPEGLIGSDGVTTRFPTRLGSFLEFLRERLRHLSELRALIPSDKEVFVITEKGMANKQNATLSFVYRKVLDLFDGFRTLRTVIDDLPFFRYHVELKVAELLVEGWIKKTIVPEIQNVDPARLSPDEAAFYIPYYKNAIKYGTDELKAREGYATLSERLGKIEEAVAQYNFLGDTLCKMGRKALAIRAYQKGLSLTRNDPRITEKILRIFCENAEQAIRESKFNEAATLYRRALEIAPAHPEIFHALLALTISRGSPNVVADLCDQATAISRANDDPEFAITALTHAIESLENEPLFRKKLINLYLDFGMTDDAADAMETLARKYIDEGKSAHGLDLIEKILRIDPGRKELRKLARRSAGRGKKRSVTRSSASLLRRVVLLAILGIACYQLWAYWEYRKVSSESYLIFATDASQEIDITESKREVKLRRLADKAEVYVERFRLSVFSFQAEKLVRDFRETALQIERMRNHEKDRMLSEAQRLFLAGDDDGAIVRLRELLKLQPGDPWRERAAEEVKRHKSYETYAAALRASADEARGRGDLQRAYELYEKLLSEYPTAKAAAGAKFPVQIAVVPPELESKLGDLPRFIELGPSESRKMSLEPEGFEPLALEIRSGRGAFQPLFFTQKPTWEKKVQPYGGYPLVAARGRLFHLSKEGDLQVLDVSTGRSLWIYRTPPLIAPSAAPVLEGPHVLLPLNDSKILKFRVAGDTLEDGRLDVDGFIQTNVTSLEGENLVFFGTSRRTIVEWRTQTHDSTRTLDLATTPARVATCGAAALLILDAEGKLLRLERRTGRVAWRSRINEDFIRGPVLMGTESEGSVLGETSRGELIAFDAMTGSIQWRRPRVTSSRTTIFMPASRRVLLCEGTEIIVEVDPITNRTLNSWQPDQMIRPFVGAVELKAGLGLFGKDGAFTLVNEKSLLPRWRWHLPGSRVRTAIQDDGHLVLMDEDGTMRAFRYPLP